MFRRRLFVAPTMAALLLALHLSAPAAMPASGQDVAVTDMTVEYAHNPLGIDAPQPLLSWVLESPERAQVQSAYRLQVASTAGRLTRGRPDVWDSGWVSSSQSVNVAYAGPGLESGGRYFWRVQVADGDG